TFLFLAIPLLAREFHPIEIPASYFTGGPEQPAYGPSSLRIAPDGTLWIANPADNTLTAIDNGFVRAQFHLDGVAGITDVRFHENGELTVLDGAAERPALLTISREGSVRERREVRAEQYGRGSPRSEGDVQQQSIAPLSFSLGYSAQPNLARWHLQTGSDAEPNGLITDDDVRIEVKATGGAIRGMRILAENGSGLYVLAEEVADVDAIAVDATVRRYSLAGKLLGIGRIPLSTQYAYVENPVAISNDGTAYLLTTKPNSIILEELTLGKSIPEILPERRRPAVVTDSLNAVSNATPLITRAQMETNARAFLNNYTYYNKSALTGSCTGRTAPRYLGTAPRWASSVSYDWDGGDSVADFNRLIASGYQAGDIATSTIESCSRGVDCFGFISRVWGVSGKYGTCTLSSISTQITTQQLMKGDILVKCNDHVVMYESSTSNGVLAYESTINNSVDRVVYASSTWSRLNGYTPRRYVNVAMDPTTPAHVTSSSSPASGAPGMTATFKSTWKNADNTPMTARLTVRAPNGATYDYTMSYAGGATTSGALFQLPLTLSATGMYGYAVTTTSLTTGRSARWPSSGFLAGPTVAGVTYFVSPSYPVCGQYPVTIRVAASLANASTVRFTVTKGNNSCSQYGSFVSSGYVDLRTGSPYGPLVASAPYYAGWSQASLDVKQTFTWGSQIYYATIRNQGYWAGPITVSAR
ncbi:MAG TPA: hypothetical protein VF215_01685, partial [Thermoanaerobaculia bacterium]